MGQTRVRKWSTDHVKMIRRITKAKEHSINNSIPTDVSTCASSHIQNPADIAATFCRILPRIVQLKSAQGLYIATLSLVVITGSWQISSVLSFRPIQRTQTHDWRLS